MQALSDEQHVAAIEAKVDKVEKKVDEGFAEMRGEMRGEFGSVRGEMQGEFRSVRAEMRREFRSVRAEMRENFREARGEIGALHRLLIQLSSGMFLTMILGFAGILLQHHL